MAGEPHGVASWPCVGGTNAAILSADYTCSHGVSPGIATVVIQPGPAPLDYGTLVITDGVFGTITLPGCRLKSLSVKRNDQGERWTLTIEDRRWRWPTFGGLSGCYNQRDRFNKIQSWTVKSPADLVAICLAAMGETRYSILLPTAGPGAIISGGEPQPGGIPVAGTYPAINWIGTPPAQALQQLAESFGCRLIYRPDIDGVMIAPLGVGAFLPLQGTSLAKDGPTLAAPARPDSLLLIGATIRYQARFLLEAVGKEWDGSIRPIDQLSYAPPASAAQSQIVLLIFGTVQVGNVFTLTIDNTNGTFGSVSFTATTTSAADVINGLATELALLQPPFGNANWLNGITFTINLTTLQINGATNGDPFTVTTVGVKGTGTQAPIFKWRLTQDALKSTRWGWSGPPSFWNVLATYDDKGLPRLTKPQAQQLAQESVFRWYRVVAVDTNTGQYPLTVPLYGPIVRRQQLILESTQVEQVTPLPIDNTLIGRDGFPLVKDFYNGFSRDKPAKCFGSYFYAPTGVSHAGGEDANSPIGSEIYVDFDIDPEYQLVKFSESVYQLLDTSMVAAPQIYLQTAVQVRDAGTNAVQRYQKLYLFPGVQAGTAPAIVRRDDVQSLVLASYDILGNVVGVVTNEAETAAMATYYLTWEAAKYELTGAQQRQYNGILPIWPDGAIQQVSWSVSEGGPMTQASRNSEHDYYVPLFQERRRLEYLAAFVQGLDVPANGAGGDDALDPSRLAREAGERFHARNAR